MTGPKKTKLVITSVVIIVIIVIIFFSLPANSKLSIGNSPVLGAENASVIIYEFTDFSCPYCQAVEGANNQVASLLKSRNPGWGAAIPAIKERYIKLGKVKVVFKYYPGHGTAEAAHAVAFGLKEQNPELFWKSAEKAFIIPNDLDNINKMIELAKTIGADEDALLEYISSKKYETQMSEDIEMAKGNGIKGTPTFFVNNKIILGAQPFSIFKEIIEKELAKS